MGGSGPPLKSKFKFKYATLQEIDAYNQYVRIVNRNYQWMSCNGLFFEYSKFMEIPLNWKVLYAEHLEDMVKIQAIYGWGQMKTIAIVGGYLGAVVFCSSFFIVFEMSFFFLFIL